MFSLWYTLLSWREYKEAVSAEKLAPKQHNEAGRTGNVDTPPISQLPKVEPSRIPIAEITNKSAFPVGPKFIPQSPPKSIPSPQNSNIKTSSPEPIRPFPKSSLDPPPKPPRSPSPHPMKSETFDDIEFESEESDEEEDEENSVIDSTSFNQKPVASNVKEFLSGEINNIQKDL
ncbi:hypothetical protein HHI36_022830 [Cryptolaemus montrouzieri]|uniref:Uncharacterized protein n=1 Tax=Cryptolaemus montrouzieri TaxID=559131 RepID=A0ABD2PF17_9CUCU